MTTFSTSPAISLAGVRHRFQASTEALADIELSVGRGEFVSIVGPSGCGKTTVLNLVAGLLPLQTGQLQVLGGAPRAGRHDVAYMLARDCLYPWLTAQGNAELGNATRGMPADRRRGIARELLRRVGLAGFEDAYPRQLSHGMRQRVALARTFAMPSPVLLMDEPFGALDAQTKLVLAEVLLELWQKEQRSVLFITHDLGEAVALSDRVVVMSCRPGRILADVRIELERPRSVRALQTDARFHRIYAELWVHLERALHQAAAPQEA